ncbi:hypothetical protein EJB05_46515, partial [Eragrostis curvula]
WAELSAQLYADITRPESSEQLGKGFSLACCIPSLRRLSPPAAAAATALSATASPTGAAVPLLLVPFPSLSFSSPRSTVIIAHLPPWISPIRISKQAREAHPASPRSPVACVIKLTGAGGGFSRRRFSSRRVEIILKRNAALRHRHCNVRFLTDLFVQDYEMVHGSIPLDDTAHTRLHTALELFRTDGVQYVEDGVDMGKRTINYHSMGAASFSDVAALISQGTPVVGSVRIDDTFAKLKAGEIYDYSPERAKKLESGEHCSHALVFVGYGWQGDNDYLVSLFVVMGKSTARAALGGFFFRHVRSLTTVDV